MMTEAWVPHSFRLCLHTANLLNFLHSLHTPTDSPALSMAVFTVDEEREPLLDASNTSSPTQPRPRKRSWKASPFWWVMHSLILVPLTSLPLGLPPLSLFLLYA